MLGQEDIKYVMTLGAEPNVFDNDCNQCHCYPQEQGRGRLCLTVYLDNFKISRLDITFGVKGQVYNFISFLKYILVLYEMQLILNVVDKLILFDISMSFGIELVL